MPPIELSLITLRTVLAALREVPVHKSENAVLHHVLVERGDGSVRFTATDLNKSVTWLEPMEIPPAAGLSRKLMETRWKREALVFLCPLADLMDVVRNAPAKSVIVLAPDRLCWRGGVPRSFATPDVGEFPPIVPSLDELNPGTNRRTLRTGRPDLNALAAACFAPVC